jgi:N-acetylglucosaminyldiphosphoundecaprenol N-acetyl-beta-D-mannosaminyltransferase
MSVAYHSMPSAQSKSEKGSYSLLGVRVDPRTVQELNQHISASIEAREKCVIGCHNLHSIYLFHREPKMQNFYRRANVVHIDGMAVVGFANLLGYKLDRKYRVTWLDWIGPLMKQAVANGWRVFCLGSAPGVAEKGAQVLRNRYPGLQMATWHGDFNTQLGSADNEEVIKSINDYQPHIVMAGLGQPRQEKWIMDHLHTVHAHVFLTPGACIEYVAGVLPSPPRILGQLGMEWLFRLLSRPRRLWRRYLLEPWFLLGFAANDVRNRFRKTAC